VALHTGTHSARLYSASDVDVLNVEQLAEHAFLRRLGPDILDDRMDADQIVTRLGSNRFRGRSLGGLYLDQSFLAGNGNYLRSEILFSARLHPRLRPVDLGTQQRQRLARETLRISRRSYRTRGITVPDKLARSGKAEGLSYESYRFWVFARESLPCRQCGTPVARIAMSSRKLFYCPSCQPAPP
jgi:endonuclease-8